MSSYLTVIQWLGTLALAFVAIGYVESFVKFLCKRVLLSDSYIDETYAPCKEALPDAETLKNISPTSIDGNSTVTQIEELKRRRETLESEIDKRINSKKEGFPLECRIQFISPISLFIVIICTLLMLYGGMEPMFQNATHCMVAIISIFSSLYIICAAICGDKQPNSIHLNFTSCKSSVNLCFVIGIISILGGIAFSIFVSEESIVKSICDKVWLYALFSFVLCSFLICLWFSIRIKTKADKLKSEISEDAKGLLSQCTDLYTEVNDYLAIGRVKEKLRTD